MDMNKQLAAELSLREEQVEKTVALLDEGNTIPFISRYRKEVTGGLDDTVLRKLEERLRYLRNIEARKAEVLDGVTDELRGIVQRYREQQEAEREAAERKHDTVEGMAERIAQLEARLEAANAKKKEWDRD